ncbi:hypothetical protein SESBI_31513 [Sesbania bispinosa]|nr:hypothetical protein SESBI_31513 [Sesbania bispinosa]
MNEFKTTPGFASAPINLTGDVQNKGQDNSVKWTSEDSRRRSSRNVNSQGQGRDLPELPKASRRQAMSNNIDSPTREKSDKSRQSRKSSNRNSQLKDSSDGSKSNHQLMSIEGDGVPEIPKKTRRKKSKDNSNGGGSSKLRSKAQPAETNLDFGENEHCERGMSGIS